MLLDAGTTSSEGNAVASAQAYYHGKANRPLPARSASDGGIPSLALRAGARGASAALVGGVPARREGRKRKDQRPMPTRTELVWDGKYDAKGNRVAPLRAALPFQTVETVNESAQERGRNLFQALDQEKPWRNRLI